MEWKELEGWLVLIGLILIMAVCIFWILDSVPKTEDVDLGVVVDVNFYFIGEREGSFFPFECVITTDKTSVKTRTQICERIEVGDSLIRGDKTNYGEFYAVKN